MRYLKKLLPAIVILSILTSCGDASADRLLKSKQFSFMPKAPTAAVKIASHQAAMHSLFSVITTFFGKEGNREIKNKVFAQLARTLKIDLLNLSALHKNGFETEAMIGISFHKGKGVYISLPHSSHAKISRFMRPFFGDFSHKRLGKLEILSASKSNTHCLISRNRVYLFQNNKPNLAKQKRVSQFFKKELKKRGAISCWLTPAARNLFQLPILGTLPVPVIATITPKKYRIDLKVTIERGYYDPIFTFVSRTLKNWRIAPTISWDNKLFSFLKIGSPYDKFAFFTKFSPNKLWKQLLKPTILASARKKMGKVLTFFSSLLGGKKSLLERQIDKLQVEKKILPALTGRVGVCVSKLNDFNFSTSSRILESFDGFFAIETKSKQVAQQLLHYLSKQIQKFNIHLAKRSRDGFTFYSMPLFRFGIPTFLFISIEGRVVTFSQKLDTLKKLHNKLHKRGNPYYTAGAFLTRHIRTANSRYLFYLSVAGLYHNIISTFDYTTQANLRPLRNLITKVNKASAALIYRNGKPQLLFSLLLSRALQTTDPFSTGQTTYDLLLLLLGIFFALLLTIPLIVFIYKKIKYRS